MLEASKNGTLVSNKSVTLPISTPRLQATISLKGIQNISIWGQGPVGNVIFKMPEPEKTAGEIVYILKPNIFIGSNQRGSLRIYALREYPAIIIKNEGFLNKMRLSLKPYKEKLEGLEGKIKRKELKDGIIFSLPQGSLATFATGLKGINDHTTVVTVSDSKIELSGEGYFVISAGEEIEVRNTLKEVLSNISYFVEKTEAYSTWVGSRFIIEDKILGSLFSHCLHTAISSYKEDNKKLFAGLSAGPGYSIPARTYYRDSYWTIQTLLPFKPEWVRKEILLLATGIRKNGEAPSAVVIPGKIGQKYWQSKLAKEPTLKHYHKRTTEWWSDHFDSPLFFILMVFDYCYWTNDFSLMEEHIGDLTIWEIILSIIERYNNLPKHKSLPLKPFNDRDWADNVFRSGLVTYNLGLYYRALVLTAKEASNRKLEIARSLKKIQIELRKDIIDRMWREKGYFIEYIEHRGKEKLEESHLSLDTLTAVRFGLLDNNKRKINTLLNSIDKILVTKNSDLQKYGSWGVMCTYPPYLHRNRLWGKSLFPYRYHNGSDWPYLDALYADLLLYLGYSNWKYPLTKWWEYGLSQGWAEPVEYYSPPWGRGAMLQAWSSMPAAAIIQGGFGFHPERKIRIPPWGESILRSVKMHGQEFVIKISGNQLIINNTQNNRTS